MTTSRQGMLFGTDGQRSALTVDQLADLVKKIFDRTPPLSDLIVEGELTEFKRHTSGHLYFTLAGQEARIACVMFKSDAATLPGWPRVGDRVRLSGRLSFYPARGTVQIYARRLQPLGEGAARRAKQELKLRLEKMGLFAPGRKRPMPVLPFSVALVTSPTGAAVHDVLNVYRKRWPAASITLVPCLVQGDEATRSMISAIRRAGNLPGVQTVMLVRGGGGRDDLNPFDDEELVIEVARCPVPVVTGVGHDVDETLCDLAADLYAPTPSAAAERLFPSRDALLVGLDQRRRLFHGLIARRFDRERQRLATARRLTRHVMLNNLHERSLRLDEWTDRLAGSLKNALRTAGARLNGLGATLEALSPLAVLERGYSLCIKANRIVRSVRELNEGDDLTLQLADGKAPVRCGAVLPAHRAN